ncbi:MAG: YgiT-type zinc finger protein [Blastocatellia bacterium]|jgi:YgiT-type zinc finger domain-containing protein|nr:YgiT-type zinc finger protein [Blastocatellia bacterium]MDQ3219710.1 YgiT-type zinc finger protein [Acidobacteriota bacterium]
MKVTAKYIPCECGGKANKQTASRTFKQGCRGSGTEVSNIPAFVCEKCGEIYFDGPSVLKVERRLEKESAIAG